MRLIFVIRGPLAVAVSWRPLDSRPTRRSISGYRRGRPAMDVPAAA